MKDLEISKLVEKLGLIGFKIANQNHEIDTVYAIGSIEYNAFYYNVFYKVKNKIYRINKLEIVLKDYKISYDKVFLLFDEGITCLKKIKLSLENKKENTPPLIKVYYYPKDSKFNWIFNYEIQYTDKGMPPDNVLEDWIKKENEILLQ